MQPDTPGAPSFGYRVIDRKRSPVSPAVLRLNSCHEPCPFCAPQSLFGAKLPRFCFPILKAESVYFTGWYFVKCR